MRIQFNQPAGPGERFAADAFDGQIGKEVPVNIEGGGKKTGRVLAAQVADDGQSVELTLDVDMQIPRYGGGSFGFTDS